jgi:hypothetical protein
MGKTEKPEGSSPSTKARYFVVRTPSGKAKSSTHRRLLKKLQSYQSLFVDWDSLAEPGAGKFLLTPRAEEERQQNLLHLWLSGQPAPVAVPITHHYLPGSLLPNLIEPPLLPAAALKGEGEAEEEILWQLATNVSQEAGQQFDRVSAAAEQLLLTLTKGAPHVR